MSQLTPFQEALRNDVAEQHMTWLNHMQVPVHMARAMFQLSALRLYDKGIVPHRGFRITPYKQFFGIKGKPGTYAEQAQENMRRELEIFQQYGMETMLYDKQ